jgi:hypothetical protein
MIFQKLTLDEADMIFRAAKRNSSLHSLRLGQALMNEMPKDIYEAVTGTELDMFHFSDDEVAEQFFWNKFI